MKEYFYKNGKKVHAGDICFYTESDGKILHYANSICRIVEFDGELFTQTIYWSDNDGMSFNKDGDEEIISLAFCCGNNDNVLQHFIYIGWGESVEEWSSRSYYNEGFGRRGQIREINKFIKKNLWNQ